ncbi:hypothetical protein ML401_28560 [Bradyrhizobium sp. 62B]|uniref:hypothetical protein n=1 Tax=Bradyrhizobium sp. 62B TaxID=2898442 RepID=UPI00255833B3|nr:hypothetical protein ML401_28560 [Bradyrhizobium sp. 62B]
MERQIIFKCPRNGMNVQHRLDDDLPAAPRNAYASVRCPACMALHFVNSTTGKLLGELSGSQPDGGKRSA